MRTLLLESSDFTFLKLRQLGGGDCVMIEFHKEKSLPVLNVLARGSVAVLLRKAEVDYLEFHHVVRPCCRWTNIMIE